MSSYYYSEQVRNGGFDYRVTRAVQRLILLNGAIFAVQLLLDVPFGGGNAGPPGGIFSLLLSFQPTSFLFQGRVWQPLTYMFIHANLMHLFFNMLWLYFFGPDVERVLGTRQFVLFYFLCGALGVMANFVPLVLTHSYVSVAGASGAVMGTLVAFAMINPHRTFFLFPIPVPLSARWLAAIIIGFTLYGALYDSRVSVATHLGGIAVGYAYMKFIPFFRDRQRIYWQKRRLGGGQKGGKNDTTGEHVDNIFKFDHRKRN